MFEVLVSWGKYPYYLLYYLVVFVTICFKVFCKLLVRGAWLGEVWPSFAAGDGGPLASILTIDRLVGDYSYLTSSEVRPSAGLLSILVVSCRDLGTLLAIEVCKLSARFYLTSI